MKSTKTLYLCLLMTLGVSVWAAPEQDLSKFFNNIKKADFKSAISSIDDSKISPSFNLLIGCLYNALGDIEMFREYTFRFNASKDDPGIFENEMSELSQKYKLANLDALIGMLFWEEGNRDLAQKYLESCLRSDPNNPYALNYSSMLYYEIDNQKYLDLSLKAISYKKDYSEAYVNAATAHYLLGNQETARSYLIQCLKNSSKPHPNVYPNLVVVSSPKSNNDDQNSQKLDQSTLDELYENVKSNREQLVGIIEFFLSSSLFSEAEYFLSKQLPPGLKISTDYFKSIMAFLSENTKEFFILSDKAIKSNLLTSNELYDLAGKYASLKQYEKSVELYKNALKLVPKNRTMLQLFISSDLGGALSANNKADEAIKYLMKAYDVYPKDFVNLVNLGRAYLSKSMKSEALKYLNLATEVADRQEQKDYAEYWLAEAKSLGQ